MSRLMSTTRKGLHPLIRKAGRGRGDAGFQMATRSPACVSTTCSKASVESKALAGTTMRDYERSWLLRSAIERGIEVISEASRHLGRDLKAPATGVTHSGRGTRGSSDCRSRRPDRMRAGTRRCFRFVAQESPGDKLLQARAPARTAPISRSKKGDTQRMSFAGSTANDRTAALHDACDFAHARCSAPARRHSADCRSQVRLQRSAAALHHAFDLPRGHGNSIGKKIRGPIPDQRIGPRIANS